MTTESLTNTDEGVEITDQMIRDQIAYDKAEYDKSSSYEMAKQELEQLKAKGCLLYADCRSCKKFFDKSCPI